MQANNIESQCREVAGVVLRERKLGIEGIEFRRVVWLELVHHVYAVENPVSLKLIDQKTGVRVYFDLCCHRAQAEVEQYANCDVSLIQAHLCLTKQDKIIILL